MTFSVHEAKDAALETSRFDRAKRGGSDRAAWPAGGAAGPGQFVQEAGIRGDEGRVFVPGRLNKPLAAGVPVIQKDPFDRMLIAQAVVEGRTLVSNDEIVGRYTGKVVW
jgi:hypothetical protein